MIEWNQENSLYYYINDDTLEKKKIVSFDLDWTLVFSEKKQFNCDIDDIKLIPNRLSKLKFLYDKGWGFVIFTNQLSRNNNEINKKLRRIETFLNNCSYPFSVFVSTKDDNYRKPNIGMFEKAKELLNGNIKTFIGDAAGRPQDFSDSDKEFAINSGMKFLIPEKVFKRPKIKIEEKGKNLIIFVGMPGSGKTTFYKNHLENKNYLWVNQDTLKSISKVKKEVLKGISSGQNICIDNCNGQLEKRNYYYELALENDYSIYTIYFIKDGRGWNKLRERVVPNIAYSMYFKYLDPPTEENTPGKLIYYI